MNKLTINPNNRKWYSEDFIKGFECGVERQFEKDKEEIKELSNDIKGVNRSIMDENTLIGFNMAVALFNKHFAEFKEKAE